MKAILSVLYLSVLVCTASAGNLSLVADTVDPDPNDVITVWVHASDPLFFLNLKVFVVGDAAVISAMSESDCDEYGWDTSIYEEPTINLEGSLYIGGICWAADANDIVGYFSFRYNSGQVVVFIDDENSFAFHWNESFTLSTDVLLFGEPTLPEPQEPNEPSAVLLQCPPNTGGSRRVSSGERGIYFDERTKEFGLLRDGLDSEPNIIVVNADITTNQIWTADNVYYINGEMVNVQSLLVIEPGTIVIFGYDCALYVNNGGAVISRGTPDEPILYTCDYLYFYYPEEIGTYWIDLYYSGYSYYFCPLYIEETASPATMVSYSFIEGATVGIATNNIRLDYPIENNYLFGNVYGIGEYGPELTDIKNNLCFFNDVSGIDVFLGDPNGIASAHSTIAIENNTCDTYQYFGITVHGVSDANETATVILVNNIVSGSNGYGLNLVDDSMRAIVANNGYYDNWGNKNWEFEEHCPIQTYEYPFVAGERMFETHFLVQDCNFIDVGTAYVEQTRLIGMTTDVNSLPDNGIIDLGFHYSNWHYVNTGIGFADTDFNQDGITDYQDLFILASQWLETVTSVSEGDLNDDGVIDFEDFSTFSAAWRKMQGTPNVTATMTISDEDRSIKIEAEYGSNSIYQSYLLIDGVYIAELVFSENIFHRTVFTPWLSLGQHEARIIGISEQGVVCSTPVSFEIDNKIGPCAVPVNFEPGEPLTFHIIADANSIQVKAHSWDDCVWQETYPMGSVSGFVPAWVTDTNDVEYLEFRCGADSNSFELMSAQSLIVPLSAMRKHDPNDIRALIVLPDFWVNRVNSGLIRSYKNLLKTRNIPYKVLGFYSSSLKNLRYYAQNYNIQYLIINSHGNYRYPGTDVLRTTILLDDGNVVSDKITRPGSPTYLERLPGDIEHTARTWAEIGFTNLKYVHNDSCYGGRLYINSSWQLTEGASGQQGLFSMPHNDMTIALNLLSNDSKFYLSWYKEFEGGYASKYYQFSCNVIAKLEEGKDLYESLLYAISQCTGSGDKDPRNDYRVLGQGFIQNFRIN